ncbi:MAG: hypothetical protein FWD96_00745 [Defluviitaleaceae bacterium]|nr:hypothetical protein [Defluviitaleaceae bacterium]
MEHEPECNEFQDTLDNHCFAGPLNLNRQTKQADTIMGTELALSSSEFDALYMLVSCEGEAIAFDKLAVAWGIVDSDCHESTVRLGLDNILHQVNHAGIGFMWIEHTADVGYTFKTRWGRCWQMQSKARAEAQGIVLPPSRPTKWSKRNTGKMITRVTAIAASIALTSWLMPDRAQTDTIYIFDDPVPLAAMPSFEGGIVFPVVEDAAVPAGSKDMAIELYNSERNSAWFVFEIAMADTGEVLYTSELSAPGTRINTVEIMPFEKGVHKATLNIRAYNIDSLVVIDSISVDFIINAS